MKNIINFFLLIAVSVLILAGCKKSVTPPVTIPPPPPSISAVSPLSGIAGATVTITGLNFDATAANNTVKFNGIQATVVSATATTLVVTAPVSGTTGAVSVATTGGTATGPVFTYLLAPTITSLSPNSAAIGATVTITGTNFDATAANNAVKFNGVVATVVSASTTQLVVTVPVSTSGNVTVTTNGGTSGGVAFTYTVVTAGPNIFVLGSDTQHGYGYWKNSTFTYMPNCSTAYAMAGTGPDVYVAGPCTTNTPTYWKNGVAVQLSNQQGFTFSITISGPDLYCVGTMNNGYYVWKNGTPTALNTTALSSIGGTNAGSYLNNAMAVSNGNVYVAGFQYLPQSTITKATYWKNGTPIDLTDGVTSGSAWATAVYVSGPDVYVAGVEFVNGGYAPRLWKNGTQQTLAAPSNSLYTSISSILVVGLDVYVGGQFNNAGAVWKNGTMINTATYSVAEHVSSMFLYNNTDLYITGASSSSGNNCYWKNGNFVEMDPGCQSLSPTCANTLANQAIAIYVQ